MLPSLASILATNLPPVRKSFSALGVCQSSEALFHWVMCSGFDQKSQTFSTGASIVFSTVITVFSFTSIVYVFCCEKFVLQCKHLKIIENEEEEMRQLSGYLRL